MSVDGWVLPLRARLGIMDRSLNRQLDITLSPCHPDPARDLRIGLEQRSSGGTWRIGPRAGCSPPGAGQQRPDLPPIRRSARRVSSPTTAVVNDRARGLRRRGQALMASTTVPTPKLHAQGPHGAADSQARQRLRQGDLGPPRQACGTQTRRSGSGQLPGDRNDSAIRTSGDALADVEAARGSRAKSRAGHERHREQAAAVQRKRRNQVEQLRAAGSAAPGAAPGFRPSAP